MKEEGLIGAAIEARLKAYAPHSKFKVGAALLTEDGRIFTGCNVENSSYGLSICAERVAVVKAVSEGCTRFTDLVLVADCEGICTPCGACRQVLFEFNQNMNITMLNLRGGKLEATVRELLPEAFELDH
ncbi:MAG TPA: cytidine deaminase [Actinobacteria bacterium]|nr:cytidine deaminase [Actinomycetota bacterium]